MPTMMHSPWFYGVLMAVLILAVVLPLVLMRVLAAREGAGGDPRDDQHLR